MGRQADLPPIFGKLNAKLHYVQRVSDVEYSAECPVCGGTIHPDGEWPDRLRIFADNKPRIWCRRCNHFAWLDELNGDAPSATKEDLEKWRKEQTEREEARRRSAETAIAFLRKSEVWEEYYSSLGLVGRQYWEQRGISRDWQDFWRLGYQPMSRWGLPSATIPLFDHAWQAVNVKHRLIGNNEPGQKYRYELSHIPAPLFRCLPATDLGGHVVAIEGEIKAMVVFAVIGDDKMAVVGLPGANPGQHIVSTFDKAEQITLVLDPGAEAAAEKLAKQLGQQRCRVLIPMMKIDDAILSAKMSAFDVKHLLAQARRI